MKDDEVPDADSLAKPLGGHTTANEASIGLLLNENNQAAQNMRSAPPNKKRRLDYSQTSPAEYVKTLNQMIEDVNSPFQMNVRDELPAGRIGLSMWSSEEKARALEALQRYSPAQLDRVAEAVRTKSPVEVKAYIEALQGGRDHEAAVTKSRMKSRWDFSKLPAAVEVPLSVEVKLDVLSDNLIKILRNEDDEISEARYGNLWRLDEAAAGWVDQQLDENDVGSTELEERLPAAIFLNLNRWLDLSANVFLNSAEPFLHMNHITYATEEDGPSIHYTAFLDFHEIALRITKKLLRTSLYIAEARYRVSPLDKKTPLLLARDHVSAAAEFLGMPSNAFEFWKTAARRNHVRVFDRDRGDGRPEDFLDYDEVERLLAQPGKRLKKVKGPQSSTSGNPPLDHDLSQDSATFSTSFDDENLSESRLDTNTSTLDLKLEELDQYNSKEEINALRKIVGMPPAEDTADDSIKTAQQEWTRRFQIQDTWTSHCEYLPEWETKLDNEAARQDSANLEREAAIEAATAVSADEPSLAQGVPSPMSSSTNVSFLSQSDMDSALLSTQNEDSPTSESDQHAEDSANDGDKESSSPYSDSDFSPDIE